MNFPLRHDDGRGWFAALICVLALAGCQPAAPPPGEAFDPNDVPITKSDVDMPQDYRTAVARIDTYHAAIRAAIVEGQPHHAHRPMDELDYVLQDLIVIADRSGVPRRDWEQVNVTARTLRELFLEIHAAIDADLPPPYEAVRPKIDAAMQRLQKIADALPKQSENPS